MGDHNPPSPEGAHPSLTAASTRHDFPGALAWGRRGREINPYNSYARGLIGDALFELGRYADGMDAYQHIG